MVCNQQEETEICVLCEEDTGIPRNCHIDDPRRNGNYVDGVGQLCNSCGDKQKK